MEKRQVAKELHAPARRRYPRRATVIRGYNDLFQADLVEMIPYARVPGNRGYKYILMVIDTWSKYLWAIPLKNKTGKEVAEAMAKVLAERVPKNLQTDHGKEFYNPEFRRLMSDYNINHYSTYSNLKAAIVERVNRTLKNAMWREFSAQGTYKWVELLPRLVREYNSRQHRTIGMAPKNVTPAIPLTVYKRLKRTAPVHFKAGDHVRVSKYKGVFEKGYTPNWSTEIFTIREVQRTNPTTYLLKDENDQAILGAFYREELQRTRYPKNFLIEKVLKRQGNRLYVKWLGFGPEANSWITKDQLLP